METAQRKTIVTELIQCIQKGNAHVSFEESVARLPAALRTRTPRSLPYSIWQLVEHMRITQWDIVEFCSSATHESPPWPKGYWPEEVPDEVSDYAWKKALAQIEEDRTRFFNLLKNPKRDLLEPFEHGDGQNLLREALLIADHNAYHTGEIIVVRRLLDAWE
ncbi:DinB family protein [Dawidia soli]|uniref:DinB family protein n=1 Tax=Dawidia soli TaxID=2782352 RepID=A0AAP2D7Z1_9BACT|nr:DinB family protein [Dawidia soli]MBT1687138.1 DinB family protein [Dawidia soli]